MKYLILFILLAGVVSCSKEYRNTGPGADVQVDSATLYAQLEATSVNQIDTMKITPTSASVYSTMMNYAEKLIRDSTNPEKSMKGEILLSVLADHLKNELEKKHLDHRNAETEMLINRLKAHKYLIYQARTPDFLKLAHHMCSGDYKYIFSRFRQESYYFPVIAGSGLILLFSLLSVTGIIRWRFRKWYNIIFLSLFGLSIAAFIIFKTTCAKNVTEDSFYGIRF